MDLGTEPWANDILTPRSHPMTELFPMWWVRARVGQCSQPLVSGKLHRPWSRSDSSLGTESREGQRTQPEPGWEVGKGLVSSKVDSGCGWCVVR